MRPAPQPSPLWVGALTGSEGAADLVPMATFGFFLGAAFQIQGDLLNLLGSEQEYGKEIEGDLSEGKRTLPLIHLLRTARGDDRQTVDYYLRLERSERTAARSCHT
jgi:geranylgeranyl diphosphate synthase type II